MQLIAFALILQFAVGSQISAVPTFRHEPKELLDHVAWFPKTDVGLVVKQGAIESHVIRTADAGRTWTRLEAVPSPLVSRFADINFFHNSTAFLFADNGTIITTDDTGETWNQQNLPVWDATRCNNFRFHPVYARRVIFFCAIDKIGAMFITHDLFKTVQLLREKTQCCEWGFEIDWHATQKPPPPKDKLDSIICASVEPVMQEKKKGRMLPWDRPYLIYSSDLFQTSSRPLEKLLPRGFAVDGTWGVSKWGGFYFSQAIVAESYLSRSDERAAQASSKVLLFTSRDGQTWRQVQVPPGIELLSGGYQIVYASNTSIKLYVSELYPDSPMGVLLNSDRDGATFSETRRVAKAHLSVFHHSRLLQLVDNADDVWRCPEQLTNVSDYISFDGGRTVRRVQADPGTNAELKSLYLNYAPYGFLPTLNGVMVARNLNGGAHGDLWKGDMWVSTNAGLQWRPLTSNSYSEAALLDQGVLVVLDTPVVHKEPQSPYQLRWSLDYGLTWTSMPLNATILSAAFRERRPTPGFQVGLALIDGDGRNERIPWIADFSNTSTTGWFDHACDANELETWSLLTEDDGSRPACIFGRRETFRRRKANATCFVDSEALRAPFESSICTCSQADFECDYLFRPQGQGLNRTCEPVVPLVIPDGACQANAKTFMGASGFRRIAETECEGGSRIDKEEVERACDQSLIAERGAIANYPAHIQFDLTSKTHRSGKSWKCLSEPEVAGSMRKGEL